MTATKEQNESFLILQAKKGAAMLLNRCASPLKVLRYSGLSVHKLKGFIIGSETLTKPVMYGFYQLAINPELTSTMFQCLVKKQAAASHIKLVDSVLKLKVIQSDTGELRLYPRSHDLPKGWHFISRIKNKCVYDGGELKAKYHSIPRFLLAKARTKKQIEKDIKNAA